MMRFKQFNSNNEVVLHLDMDGVFADFVNGARNCYEHFDKIHGLYHDTKMTSEQQTMRKQFVENIVNTENFWLNLGWEPGGQQVFEYISQNFNINNLAVITAPIEEDIERCVAEKWLWVQKNFNNMIRKENFVADHNKHNYVGKLHSGKYQILLDDRIENIKRWEQCGGIGILHDSANYENSIKALTKFI